MGRTVSVRTSYQNDIMYLMRFSHSIELDEKLSVKTRKQLMAKVNDLCSELLVIQAGLMQD